MKDIWALKPFGSLDLDIVPIYPYLSTFHPPKTLLVGLDPYRDRFSQGAQVALCAVLVDWGGVSAMLSGEGLGFWV